MPADKNDKKVDTRVWESNTVRHTKKQNHLTQDEANNKDTEQDIEKSNMQKPSKAKKKSISKKGTQVHQKQEATKYNTKKDKKTTGKARTFLSAVLQKATNIKKTTKALYTWGVKHKKGIFWTSISVGILVVLYVLFVLGISLRFLLFTTLLIRMQSDVHYVEIQNEQVIEFNVDVSIDSFFTCKQTCQFDIIDHVANVSVFSHTFFDTQTIPVSFLVNTTTNNIRLYGMKTTCTITPSRFCPDKQKTHTQTDILTAHIFLSKTQVQQAKKTEALLVQHIDNEALYSKMRNFTQGVKQLPYQQTNNITIPSYIPIGETLLSYWELYAFGTIQHMVHQSNIIEINRDMLMQFSQARQLALLHNDIQDVIQQIQDAYTQQNISFNVPAFAEAYQDNSSSSIVYDIDKKKALLTVNISEEIEHVQQKLNDAFLYATLQQQWDGNVSTLLLAYQHITPTTVTCADITALSTSFPMQSLPVDDIECIISQNCTPSLLNVSVDILSSIQETYCTHVRIKEPQQTIEIITLQVDPIQIPDLPTWCCAQTCTLCKEHKVIPVLFIHGHAFNRHNTVEASMLAFSDIQQELEQKGIINRGQWLWEQQPDVVWNFFEQPSSIRSSYYFIWNLQVGSYSIQAQQSERLENYALRLREMIQHITLASGSDEVIVVAHSMGGLVARKYMQLFGEDTIHTLITINTPHYGITHRIARFCSWFGASKECEDMRDDSIFMQRLHLQKMKDTPVYSVVSIGCLMEGQQGDGIVTQDSATWNQANIIIIEGECTDTFNTNLHTDVLDPKKYPQLIDILSDILLHKE